VRVGLLSTAAINRSLMAGARESGVAEVVAVASRDAGRARAYADAGANGFFVPLLADLKLLERMCANSPLPVNFMTFPGCPSNAAVAATGIARISYGPFPYRDLMKQLEEEAAALLR